MNRVAASCFAIVYSFAVYGQTAPAPARPAPARNIADLIKPLEESGFQPIFDGKSLTGWDGDPGFLAHREWRDVGETATDKQPKQNTFLIWRGGTPGNFELKLEYRLTGYNSGIQYRQRRIAGQEMGHERLPGRYRWRTAVYGPNL